MKKYLINLLIGFDQLLNTMIGGYPDETMSSRFGRTRRRNKASDIVCDVLDQIDAGHCEESIEYDDTGNPRPRHMEKL